MLGVLFIPSAREDPEEECRCRSAAHQDGLSGLFHVK